MSAQLSILDLIAEGTTLREKGMQQAIDHADRNFPAWSERAYGFLKKWLNELRPGKHFKTEDFRIKMELDELIERPPSDRAYGSLITRAAKAGLIRKIGHGTVVNPKAHRCYASLWEKV